MDGAEFRKRLANRDRDALFKAFKKRSAEIRDGYSFDELEKEVMADPVARMAALENSLRRELAAVFEAARKERGLSIKALAKEIGTSVSQVQRLLHKEQGGSLSIMTVLRASEALGLTLQIKVQPKDEPEDTNDNR